MREVSDAIERVSNKLNGRVLSLNEKEQLGKAFDIKTFPPKLIEVLEHYKVIGQTFSISRESDPSKMGVEMKWLTPDAQIEESFDYYPGLLFINKGYLPIGECLKGSGDPYFIKSNLNSYLVVRIPHDSRDQDDSEYICTLADLFNYID